MIDDLGLEILAAIADVAEERVRFWSSIKAKGKTTS